MFLDSFHWEAKTSVRIFWVKVIFLILVLPEPTFLNF
jgi:hypothetical protein